MYMSIRTLYYVIFLHQANLSKTTKHWDGFVSHCISYTTIAVVDGIVISSQHCAYDDCISELANSRGASFCPYHEHLHGAKCHVKNCDVQKIAGTQAHQGQWNRHV